MIDEIIVTANRKNRDVEDNFVGIGSISCIPTNINTRNHALINIKLKMVLESL